MSKTKVGAKTKASERAFFYTTIPNSFKERLQCAKEKGRYAKEDKQTKIIRDMVRLGLNSLGC